MRNNLSLKVPLLLLLYLPFSSHAQKSLQAFRLEEPITVDGIHEPEKWAGADSALNFVQMEPQSGQPTSEQTLAFFGFDDENIYATFICYQYTPVIAKNQIRDALSKADDMVAFMLDSYQDNRSGYVFFTNALGTQYDMKVNDDGRNLDFNWDTEWRCNAAEFEGGWCAEFEIPFKSLKYRKGLNTWGVNFGRIIRSNFETAYWSGTLTDDFRVSQGGVINGIETPGSQMKLTAFPYLSVFKTSKKGWNLSAGGDLRWQISPNASFNGTVNPDFATVEADQRQINLTRYELSYPEKRLFFQEGNEMYNTRIKTFYSRRIKDIDYGGRLNGKVGKMQFNVLSVVTPDFNADSPATYFTAARGKIDVLKSSTLGFTFVDKTSPDVSTRSLSMDYVLNFGKMWKLTGQFVGSTPEELSSKDLTSNSAWFTRFAHESNTHHFHVRYTEIGKNFRENVNQTGFIVDDDRREIDSDIIYKWWLKNNTFEYIDFQSRNNVFWSHEKGHLRSWYLTDIINFYFKNRFNVQYAYNNEYKLFEKDFYNYKHTFTLGYNTDEWSHAMISYTTGKNFDKNLQLISGGFRIKPFDNFSFTYSANHLKRGEEKPTFLNVLVADYNFTKDLWIRIFAQNDQKEKYTYFYGLTGWRFKPPFGALYLIYSLDRYGREADGRNTNSFFVKITYPISLAN